MADALHNSYETYYRSPQGAVTCGSEITLRLRVDAARPIIQAELVLWSHTGTQRFVMRDTGIRGAWHGYEVTITAPDSPGLIWYHFYVQTQGYSFFVGNAADGLGGTCYCYDVSPPSYQITVYSGEFETPEWMHGSVMYQIFPDRFYDGHDGALLSRRKDILVHKNWNEAPFRIPDPVSGDNTARDFFGGNLKGIEKKLDYLQSMGVNVIYLNPIFQANSNHKYDTGDYTQIDPTFGNREEFISLCREAEKKGIRVVLDGVFSHTGEDSVYFNRYGNYPGVGAYQSQDSPYSQWYNFRNFPNDYVCWWGVPTLPEINEMTPTFLDFIIRSDDAVVARWLRAGASGWRLDVADELPDEFIEMLRTRIKTENKDAGIIGEVWEDATNKIAYGKARKYALGYGLDSVMNYPLRSALIDFLRGGEPAAQTRRRLLNQKENYPLPMYYSLMNLLGSHDRARILNVLSGCDNPPVDKDLMGEYCMERSDYNLGRDRLKLMLAMVNFLPGMPCVYYGDEAGVEGLADPFCRKTYPWGKEDTDLQRFFRDTLMLRNEMPTLRTGDINIYSPNEDVVAILRTIRGGRDVFGDSHDDAAALLIVNRGAEYRRVVLDLREVGVSSLHTREGLTADCTDGMLSISVPPRGLHMLFA